MQHLRHVSLWRARDYEETRTWYIAENVESCIQPFRYGVLGDTASCSGLGSCWSPQAAVARLGARLCRRRMRGSGPSISSARVRRLRTLGSGGVAPSGDPVSSAWM